MPVYLNNSEESQKVFNVVIKTALQSFDSEFILTKGCQANACSYSLERRN